MKTTFQDILKEAQEKWMNIEGVVGVGQGKKDNEDCIDVYIANNSDEIKNKIPKEYKDVPVVFRKSGGPFVSQK